MKGYWKLRVGDYRVVFKIVQRDVWILGIGHRKEVHEKIGWLTSGWRRRKELASITTHGI